MSKYVITYDVGTTGVKTCLIEIGDTMRILLLTPQATACMWMMRPA